MSERDFASEIVANPNDPYPVYDALREHARVYFSPTWKCWVLTHHQDISGVLLNPEVFSSRGRVTNVIQREFPEDVISELATLEREGDRLAEDELLSTCVTLLVAGHETTTNLIASATWLLLRHPEQRAALRADPALMPSAIEEVLRFESPLHRVGRTALIDTEIAGTRIRKGETVFLLLAAANRDPAQFSQPNRFDIRRSPNKHLAFGYGIHFCLGAALARLEAPLALQALFERWPEARLAEQLPPWHSGVMRGLQRLPLNI